MTDRPYMPKAGRDDWGTPNLLWLSLMFEFGFDVDAAASDENHLLPEYWTKETDGLDQDWGSRSVYVNPPFNHKALAAWAEKAWRESRKPGCVVVMLVPVKSDQQWFHDYALRAEVRFIRGRVSFKGSDGCFPGPLAILVFGLNYGPRMVGMERPT